MTRERLVMLDRLRASTPRATASVASGRKVIVISDHGTGDHRGRVGPVQAETEMPFHTGGFACAPARALRQTHAAGLICHPMGLDPGAPPAFPDITLEPEP